MFGWYYEVDAWSRFWRWNLINICVWTCDMNSTLGSVVPLAMFTQLHLGQKLLLPPVYRVTALFLCVNLRSFPQGPLLLRALAIRHLDFAPLWNEGNLRPWKLSKHTRQIGEAKTLTLLHHIVAITIILEKSLNTENDVYKWFFCQETPTHSNLLYHHQQQSTIQLPLVLFEQPSQESCNFLFSRNSKWFD